jgi:glutamate N-acetyltransferase/amino-acid N-acetyltransferase
VSITAAAGFAASGIHGGVKADGALDLALIATADGVAVPAAAVFTQNHMAAAPVVVSRNHLRLSRGLVGAVLCNSGNANAATGEQGVGDAQQLIGVAGAEMGLHHHQVLMCSTGLIGIPLPVDPVLAAIPALVAARSTDGGTHAAEAILTTDTVRKEVVVEGHTEAGGTFTVGGMAKGAAMLAPNMATMLAFLTTDAEATPEQLQRALSAGVGPSFNSMTIDGCTSTNDTVILMASGAAGPVSEQALSEAVTQACCSLAAQMVGDAEGATKVVRVNAVGAATDDDAAAIVRKTADSLLVKSSWYGEDPYWGRIASEAGSCGARMDPALLCISYGDIEVARHGIAHEHDEAALKAYMAQRELEITIDLRIGQGRATILTNDLTHAYIDENMGTS